VTRRQVEIPALPVSRTGDVLFLCSVLLLAAGLLLCRLDDIYLWQDEAETALVARNLLAFGLPLSTDGRVWVQQSGESFAEFTSDYVWIYHSWLQYVLVAASFALLGPTTLAARLPSVLVGLATIALFYDFVLRWMEDRRVARVATVFLVVCVPFLLLLRQCRYYALAALFTMLTVDGYLRLRSERRWALPYFVLAAVLLYHSHYGAFFPTLAALGIHWLLTRPESRLTRRFLTAVVLVGAQVLPWAIFMRVLDRGQPFRLDRFLAHIGQSILYASAWVFPLVLALTLAIAWLRQGRGEWLALTSAQARFCSLASLVVVTQVVMLSASAAFDWVYFRYLVNLIPLLLVMLAVVVVQIVQRCHPVGYALLLTLLASNAMGMLPYALPGIRNLDMSRLWPGSAAFQSLQDVWVKAGRFRSDPWMYAQELSNDYAGPNEGLIAYLSAHAQTGQTVAVNYEDLPLMFYTDLRVLGGLGLHGLNARTRPDWVVDRKHGPYRDLLADIVQHGSYERIEIPYPDIRWENRPQPGEHHYLTVQDGDPVVLYRRTGD
jgi:4-amino-4-deoxy-L-arabinose transferase-like glycosyltransferase